MKFQAYLSVVALCLVSLHSLAGDKYRPIPDVNTRPGEVPTTKPGEIAPSKLGEVMQRRAQENVDYKNRLKQGAVVAPGAGVGGASTHSAPAFNPKSAVESFGALHSKPGEAQGLPGYRSKSRAQAPQAVSPEIREALKVGAAIDEMSMGKSLGELKTKFNLDTALTGHATAQKIFDKHFAEVLKTAEGKLDAATLENLKVAISNHLLRIDENITNKVFDEESVTGQLAGLIAQLDARLKQGGETAKLAAQTMIAGLPFYSNGIEKEGKTTFMLSKLTTVLKSLENSPEAYEGFTNYLTAFAKVYYADVAAGKNHADAWQAGLKAMQDWSRYTLAMTGKYDASKIDEVVTRLACECANHAGACPARNRGATLLGV